MKVRKLTKFMGQEHGDVFPNGYVENSIFLRRHFVCNRCTNESNTPYAEGNMIRMNELFEGSSAYTRKLKTLLEQVFKALQDNNNLQRG